MRRSLLSLVPLLLVAASCASHPAGPATSAEPASPDAASTAHRRSRAFTDAQVIDLFVRLREGERRRDPSMTIAVLEFDSTSDKRFHVEQLAYLLNEPAGPIRAPQEIEVIGRPDRGPDGNYMLLEPIRGWVIPVSLEVVSSGDGPRIRYERPPFSEAERRGLPPSSLRSRAVRARIEQWSTLDGSDLDDEVARTLVLLRQQIAARDYARDHGLRMMPMSPDPQVTLAELEDRSADDVRQRVITRLRQSN